MSRSKERIREHNLRYQELIKAKNTELADYNREDLIKKIIGLEIALRESQRDANHVRRRVIELDRALLKIRDSVIFDGKNNVAFASVNRDLKIVFKNVERILIECGYGKYVSQKKGQADNGEENKAG